MSSSAATKKENKPKIVMNTRVFLDMDGVFCDFETKLRELEAKEAAKGPQGQVLRIPNPMNPNEKLIQWNTLFSIYPDFFAEMDWMPMAEELWYKVNQYIQATNQEIPIFLTGCPDNKQTRTLFEEAVEGKSQWILTHLRPNNLHKLVLLPSPPGADTKAYAQKSKENLEVLIANAKKGDIIAIFCRPIQKNYFNTKLKDGRIPVLIDDREDAHPPWRNSTNGAIGIHHLTHPNQSRNKQANAVFQSILKLFEGDEGYALRGGGTRPQLIRKIQKTRKLGVKQKQQSRRLSTLKRYSKKIEKLLWLDRQPVSNKIILIDEKPLNILLKYNMIQLGATEDILNIKCFAICGPTGVGKTKFINHLKENFNVETINMDTMQVYNTISVGTGRTNLATSKGSHIYGVYNPNKEFHIIDYLVDVFKALKNIHANGNIPIFEGASTSLLSVLLHILPNLTVFGIKAKNDKNIKDNITKRISKEFIENAIIELQEGIKKNEVEYNSPVLSKNWVVYDIIIKHIKKNDFLKEDFKNNIEKISSTIDIIVKKAVACNIQLHYQQLKRLLKIPNIIWFSNADESIQSLQKTFQKIKDKEVLHV